MNARKAPLAGAILVAVFFAYNVQVFAQQDQNPSPLPPLEQPHTPNNDTQPSTQQPSGQTGQQLPDNPDSGQVIPGKTSEATPAQQPTPGAPSGTAAAPAGRLSGNAASRPAGAAIAPPKQRQVRSFLIKLGFVAGAAAALGTVAALSMASPARVPNSR